VFRGTRSAFRPGNPRHPAHVTDGLANTFGVVEASPPVPWTKPADLGDRRPVAWPFANVASVSTLDARAHQFDPATVPAAVLAGMIGADDGQVIGPLPRVPLEAETPEEKAELAALKAETDKLIAELEAETAESVATLQTPARAMGHGPAERPGSRRVDKSIK
jgi:hypothetical protein